MITHPDVGNDRIHEIHKGKFGNLQIKSYLCRKIKDFDQTESR